MQQNAKLLWFKILSWWVGLYHTALGLIGLLASPEVIPSVASKVYHLSVSSNLQFVVAARFASAYMLALGVMAILMAQKPKQYSVFVWPILIMIGFRIFTRLVHGGDIITAFGGSATNNMITILVIGLIGIGLLAWRPKNQ